VCVGKKEKKRPNTPNPKIHLTWGGARKAENNISRGFPPTANPGKRRQRDGAVLVKRMKEREEQRIPEKIVAVVIDAIQRLQGGAEGGNKVPRKKTSFAVDSYQMGGPP